MNRINTALRALSYAGVLSLMIPLAAMADGLRVSPVTLEVIAPGATSTLTLRNDGRDPMTVQARVFLWEQVNGQERLQPTDAVVVSPPMTQLRPGAEQTVRVVRTSSTPVRGEEAYRVYIDEVPDRSRLQAGQVAFATRLRIPVFFTDAQARMPQVGWSLVQSGGTMYLEARNAGDVRLRLANMELMRGNAMVFRRNGLFGYVLGGSSMRWPLGSAGRIGTASGNLRATTNRGILNAPVVAR